MGFGVLAFWLPEWNRDFIESSRYLYDVTAPSLCPCTKVRCIERWCTAPSTLQFKIRSLHQWCSKEGVPKFCRCLKLWSSPKCSRQGICDLKKSFFSDWRNRTEILKNSPLCFSPTHQHKNLLYGIALVRSTGRKGLAVLPALNPDEWHRGRGVQRWV